MLKRQRPHSPFPAARYGDSDAKSVDTPLELSERLAKRRRYIESPLDEEEDFHSESGPRHDTFASNDEEDGRETEYYAGDSRRWQEQAGIYKESNTLLHDLHAEQRHRMIFAANSQATLSISSRTPSLQSEQQSRSLSLPHACKPSASDPSSDARNDEAESQVVADRYEETNRYARPD